jgi:hypothetical protein
LIPGIDDALAITMVLRGSSPPLQAEKEIAASKRPAIMGRWNLWRVMEGILCGPK